MKELGEYLPEFEKGVVAGLERICTYLYPDRLCGAARAAAADKPGAAPGAEEESGRTRTCRLSRPPLWTRRKSRTLAIWVPRVLAQPLEEFAMRLTKSTCWAWLLPTLALMALPGLPALAADRIIIAEEFTNNG